MGERDKVKRVVVPASSLCGCAGPTHSFNLVLRGLLLVFCSLEKCNMSSSRLFGELSKILTIIIRFPVERRTLTVRLSVFVFAVVLQFFVQFFFFSAQFLDSRQVREAR